MNTLATLFLDKTKSFCLKVSNIFPMPGTEKKHKSKLVKNVIFEFTLRIGGIERANRVCQKTKSSKFIAGTNFSGDGAHADYKKVNFVKIEAYLVLPLSNSNL